MDTAELTGTWEIDPGHTRIGFATRHAMVTKVRGAFNDVTGEIVVDGENPDASTATVIVQMASIDTRNAQRDEHLRSADFFDVESHPTISFRSTGVREASGGFVVDGDLTIKGVTRPVSFDLELGGFGVDPWGNRKAGATATATIDREQFGLTWNAALETGGVLVGKDVKITLDLQGALQA